MPRGGGGDSVAKAGLATAARTHVIPLHAVLIPARNSLQSDHILFIYSALSLKGTVAREKLLN